MKVLVISYHDLNDNRINKHINSICKFAKVVYINISIPGDDIPSINENCIVKNIPIEISKKNILGAIFTFFKIFKIINESDADIIHIHDPLLLTTLKGAKKRKMRTVYDKHESYEICGGVIGRISPILDKVCNKYLDSVVYVNSSQEKYLKQFNNKLCMIPNFQSIEHYEKYKKCYLHKEVQIVYFGVLSQGSRDITFMLDVIESVLSKRTNVRCIIGGKIVSPFIEEKIEYISQNYNKFSYLGYVSYDEVVRITCEADIGLYFQKDVPNNFGSSPNKIFEYLIAGLAIVSIGRYEYWDIIDSTAGKAFRFDVSKEEVSQYIISLIDNYELLDRIKKNSLDLSSKFTWEAVENRYEELYEDLLCV